ENRHGEAAAAEADREVREDLRDGALVGIKELIAEKYLERAAHRGCLRKAAPPRLVSSGRSVKHSRPGRFSSSLLLVGHSIEELPMKGAQKTPRSARKAETERAERPTERARKRDERTGEAGEEIRLRDRRGVDDVHDERRNGRLAHEPVDGRD